MPLFLSVLMEKLNAKERTELIKIAALEKSEVAALAAAGRSGQETREGC